MLGGNLRCTAHPSSHVFIDEMSLGANREVFLERHVGVDQVFSSAFQSFKSRFLGRLWHESHTSLKNIRFRKEWVSNCLFVEQSGMKGNLFVEGGWGIRCGVLFDMFHESIVVLVRRHSRCLREGCDPPKGFNVIQVVLDKW